MGIVIVWVVFILLGYLFGHFCAEAWSAIEQKDGRKSWLAWVILVIGILYVLATGFMMDYNWKHRNYDTTKYEIIRDTVITNHNGQIDTTATFKVVGK